MTTQIIEGLKSVTDFLLFTARSGGTENSEKKSNESETNASVTKKIFFMKYKIFFYFRILIFFLKKINDLFYLYRM